MNEDKIEIMNKQIDKVYLVELHQTAICPECWSDDLIDRRIYKTFPTLEQLEDFLQYQNRDLSMECIASECLEENVSTFTFYRPGREKRNLCNRLDFELTITTMELYE